MTKPTARDALHSAVITVMFLTICALICLCVHLSNQREKAETATVEEQVRRDAAEVRSYNLGKELSTCIQQSK